MDSKQESNISNFPLMKTFLTVFFALILFAGQLSAANPGDLPDIGESTGTLLSPEFERRLGQSFLNHIRRHTPIQDDPEIETYIQSIGYRLVANSDGNERQFTFFVIDDSMINAFAAPGGIVGINAGVILNSATESELAAVMAHEVVHVTQKHMARGAEAQSKMSVPMMAAMLGAILVATQNPEAGQAAIIAIQGGAAQAFDNPPLGDDQGLAGQHPVDALEYGLAARCELKLKEGVALRRGDRWCHHTGGE